MEGWCRKVKWINKATYHTYGVEEGMHIKNQLLKPVVHQQTPTKATPKKESKACSIF